MRRLLLGALAAAGAALALGGVSASGLLVAGPRAEALRFTVEPGESVASVVRRLDAEGRLPDRPLFGPRVVIAWARLTGADRGIKSGEYELPPGETPIAILRRLHAGEIRTVAVTLPEGLRLDEIAARLDDAGVTDGAALAALADDPGFVRSVGVDADSLEGYLYPETYRFRPGTSPEEALRTMVEEFHRRWTEADRERLEASGMTRHEAVTLASLVEKETAVSDERPLIAAVFANRLRRGMRLQSDPTVIYGIVKTRGAFDGNLRKRDLLADNPYNTYTRGGLPAGPITNPTIESIRATLAPADVPYLYFVSRNDGTHVFSRTLVEHTRAVDRYQRRRPGSSG